MINWKRADELRGEVGPEDFDEVVEIFLEEVDEMIERIETSPDPALFEDDFHFLKGCALNLGFQKLGDVCSAGEYAAAQSALPADAFQEAVRTYEKSRAEFLAALGRYAA